MLAYYYSLISKTAENVGVTKEGPDRYICTADNSTNETIYKWFCKFNTAFVELGLTAPNDLNVVDKVIYRAIVITTNRIVFFYEYQPKVMQCLCSIEATNSPVFTLPKKTIIVEVLPENNTLIQCKVTRTSGNSGLRFYWTCIFSNKVYDLAKRANGPKNALDFYFFGNLNVINDILKKTYLTSFNDILCKCNVIINNFNVEIAKDFTLPKLDSSKTKIIPDNFKFNYTIECSMGISDLALRDFSFKFLCTISNKLYTLGNAAQVFQNTFDEYVYKSAVVTKNKLYFRSIFQPTIIKCFCDIEWLMVRNIFKKSIYFNFPISSTPITYIVPRNFTFGSSIKCIVNITDSSFFKIQYVCNFSGLLFILGTTSTSNLSDFYKYVVGSLKLTNNELKFDNIFQPIIVSCWCEAYWTIRKQLYNQHQNFMLPRSDSPPPLIVPKNFTFSSTIKCFVNLTDQNRFVIQYACNFGGNIFALGTPVTSNLSTFFQYVARSLSLTKNELTFGNIYQPDNISCYCEATWITTKTLYQKYINFKLPKSEPPSLTLVPEQFTFNSTIKCVINITDSSLFKMQYVCIFDKKLFILGSPITNLSSYYQYVASSLTVRNNELTFGYIYQPTVIVCYCEAFWTIAERFYHKYKNFNLPKSNQSKVKIDPLNYTFNSTITCSVENEDDQYQIQYFCQLGTYFPLGRLNFQSRDPFYVYVYRSLVVNGNKLFFKLIYQPTTIYCYCNAYWKRAAYLFDKNVSFNLPNTGNLKLKLDPLNYTFNSTITCTTNSYEDDFTLSYYCDINGVNYELGKTNVSRSSNMVKYIYNSLTVRTKELHFGIIYQPYDVTCYCECSFNIADYMFNDYVYFPLPKSAKNKLQITPLNYTFNTLLTCTTGNNDALMQFNFFCVFTANGAQLECKLGQISCPGLNIYNAYIYKGLIVNNNTLFFEIIYQPFDFWCSCNAYWTVVPSMFNERVTFKLPKTNVAKIKIVPVSFSFNSTILCTTGLNDSLFLIEYFCKFSTITILLGSTNTSQLNQFYLYVFNSLNVTGNNLTIENMYQPEVIQCYCLARFTLIPAWFQQYVNFYLPKTGKITLKLNPSVFTFNYTITCSTGLDDKLFAIAFFCFMDNKILQLGNQTTPTNQPFYKYVYESLNTVSSSLHFGIIYQPELIPCYCNSFFAAMPRMFNKNATFNLPKSGIINLKIVPARFTFNSTIQCLTGLNDDLFVLKFFCDIDNKTVRLGDNPAPLLPSFFQYIYKSLIVIRNSLHFQLIFQPYVIQCYCNAYFGVMKSMFNRNISFLLPKSVKPNTTIVPSTYTFGDNVTCVTGLHNSLCRITFYCNFNGINYILGNPSLTIPDAFNDYIYKSLTVDNDRLQFGKIYNPNVVSCYCNAYLNVPPNEINQTKEFTLPETVDPYLVLKPKAPAILTTLECSILPSNMGFKFTFYCKFPSKEVTVNKTTTGLTLYEEYVFNRLMQKDQFLFFNFSYQIEEIRCYCNATVETFFFLTSEDFLLPKEALPSIFVRPTIPILYQDMDCSLSRGEDVFDLSYWCQMGFGEYKMGQSQLPTGLQPQYEYLYKRLRVVGGNMSLAYLRHIYDIPCFCFAQFKYGKMDKKSDTFTLPLSSSQLPYLNPKIPVINTFLKCGIGTMTHLFFISWWCKFDKDYVMLSLKNQTLQNDYSKYIFDNVEIDKSNSLFFNYPINIKNIPCLCNASYLADPTLEIQSLKFSLPETDAPNLTVTTVYVPKRISKCQILKYDKYFTYHWECTYHNYSFSLNDPNITKEKNGEIRYIFQTIRSKNNEMYVDELYSPEDISCECRALFLNSSKILPEYSVNHTIPKSKEPFQGQCIINCSAVNCVYNIFTLYTINCNCNFTYRSVMPYANFQMKSIVLKLDQIMVPSYSFTFFPFRKVNPSVGCKSIIWSLIWQNSTLIIDIDEWNIQFINQSTAEIMEPPTNIKNRALIDTVTLTCSLIDPQISGRLLWVFSMDNHTVINYIYVQGRNLKTVINSSSEYIVIIKCAIFMIDLRVKQWCRIFRYGKTILTITVKSYEALTVTPPTYSPLVFPAMFYNYIEMYYPIDIVITRLTICPQISMVFNETYNNTVPYRIIRSFVSKYNVEGLYQFHYVYYGKKVNLSVPTLTSYVFYTLPILVYIDPNIFNRGSSVTCKSNSTDILFIFQWACFFYNVEYVLKLNAFDFPNTPQDVLNKLSNLVLSDSQTIVLDYLIPSGYYECVCTAISLITLGNNSINASRTYRFTIDDYVPGQMQLQEAVFGYTIMAMIGWMLLVIFVFCRLSAIQFYRHKASVYSRHIRTIRNITNQRLISHHNIYKQYHIGHFDPLFHELLVAVNDNYARVEVTYRKTLHEARFSHRRSSSATETDISHMGATGKRKKRHITDQSLLYRIDYKKKNRKSNFIRKRVESFLRKMSSAASSEELDVESIFESRFPRWQRNEAFLQSAESKAIFQSGESKMLISSTLMDESTMDNSYDVFPKIPKDRRKSERRSIFEINQLRFREPSIITDDHSYPSRKTNRDDNTRRSRRESLTQMSPAIFKEYTSSKSRSSLRSFTTGADDNSYRSRKDSLSWMSPTTYKDYMSSLRTNNLASDPFNAYRRKKSITDIQNRMKKFR